MTFARSQLVDLNLTRWYHVISKTVRGAFLLGEGEFDRKQWMELLSNVFAVEAGGFAILDNHLHVVVRLEPEQLDGDSDEDVLRRWATVFPPRPPIESCWSRSFSVRESSVWTKCCETFRQLPVSQRASVIKSRLDLCQDD